MGIMSLFFAINIIKKGPWKAFSYVIMVMTIVFTINLLFDLHTEYNKKRLDLAICVERNDLCAKNSEVKAKFYDVCKECELKMDSNLIFEASKVVFKDNFIDGGMYYSFMFIFKMIGISVGSTTAIAILAFLFIAAVLLWRRSTKERSAFKEDIESTLNMKQIKNMLRNQKIFCSHEE